MSVKLLTEHYLKFLSLKGGYTCLHLSYQNATLLEIMYHASFVLNKFDKFHEQKSHLLVATVMCNNAQRLQMIYSTQHEQNMLPGPEVIKLLSCSTQRLVISLKNVYNG